MMTAKQDVLVSLATYRAQWDKINTDRTHDILVFGTGDFRSLNQHTDAVDRIFAQLIDFLEKLEDDEA